MAAPLKSNASGLTKKPSTKIVIVTVALLAIAGAAIGFSFGLLNSAKESQEKSKPEKAGSADSKPVKNDDHDGKEATDTTHDKPDAILADEKTADEPGGITGAIPLDPILTNISVPPDVWVRLEVVLKTSAPVSKDTTDQIHQDYLAFFHSMRLSELNGASAFINLKDELLSRANVRAKGKIEAVYIKTFLFE